MNTKAQHIRPFDVAKSLYRVMQNPDDTSQVFKLFDAASGNAPNAFTRRFERSPKGAELLADRPDLLTLLADRDKLAAMPDGSLGRGYLAFMQRDGLSAEFLVKASATADSYRGDAPHEFIARRMRDAHDLWHVVTGYGGDLLGEAAVLSFTYAQTFAPAVGLLVSVGYVRSGDPDARHVMIDAFSRGISAAWLPVVRWEKLLDKPLTDVREMLRVGPPRAYEPFFAKDLPKGGLLARAA